MRLPPATPRIRVGLCSVTFRALSADAVLDAAVSARLESIEWGSDIHVPVGDLDEAHRVGTLTRSAGITVSSYGSYFRCDDASEIAPLLASADALGAPRIRVWAGRLSSAEASPEHRAHTLTVLEELVSAAAERHIEIALEFHGGTLTDTRESASDVLDAVPAASSYWQPATAASDDEALADLHVTGARTSTAHVFSWAPDGTRLRLDGRAAFWRRAIDTIDALPAVTDLLLEFVPANDPAILFEEAALLRSWRDEAAAHPR